MARMIPLHSLFSHTEIERLAYVFFEEEGRHSGRELDHWLRAEAEFAQTINSFHRQAATTPSSLSGAGQVNLNQTT
jgi:hypothetical protein